jgi:transcriptional regulator with XRE-family HTH domain
VAELAGISVASLNRIESGDHDPSWGDIRHVARGLGVSMEVLAEVAEAHEEGKTHG